MVYLRYTLKGAYLLAICAIVFFIYGIAAYLFFDGRVDETVLDEVLMPGTLFIIGLILLLGQQIWQLNDPNANISIWGVQLSTYGKIGIVLGLFLFGEYFFTNGWTQEICLSLFFNLGAAIIMLAAFFAGSAFWQKKKKN